MYPVHVTAHHDTPARRWLWLVKWVLLIPHYALLVVLWLAFAVGTLIGYVAVIATGRYPSRLFGFGVGVLRVTWRVVYYGYVVLGTDRYPPFTLANRADYPAELDIDPTLDRKRWLPLVAWLLTVPHVTILAGLLDVHLLHTISIGRFSLMIPIGVASTGITVIGIQLGLTGRHPRGLYDLFTGVARWALRTVAYVTLLTDVYPPFRLDQGGAEPTDASLDPAAETDPAAGTSPNLGGGRVVRTPPYAEQPAVDRS